MTGERRTPNGRSGDGDGTRGLEPVELSGVGHPAGHVENVRLEGRPDRFRRRGDGRAHRHGGRGDVRRRLQPCGRRHRPVDLREQGDAARRHDPPDRPRSPQGLRVPEQGRDQERPEVREGLVPGTRLSRPAGRVLRTVPVLNRHRGRRRLDHRCGRPWRPLTGVGICMMLAAGDLLDDRYRLVERIAAGGMGDVWRATDEELGRTVAVKTLRLGVGHDAGFEERFRREARTMAGLRHPGVAPVYDYRETSLPGGPDLAYIVMACVTGQPLSESLAQNGRFDVMTTMSIVGQAARALQSVHESGVVHRDVKPANLIVEPDGHLVLVDFGVALTKGLAGMTDADVVVGTALYMAPEQVTRAPVGPAADVYALGAVAYQCLAGEPPFGGAMALEVAMRHVDDNLPPLPDDVPVAAHRFVAVAMAKDPARRF